jgi:hypothetical protein
VPSDHKLIVAYLQIGELFTGNWVPIFAK